MHITLQSPTHVAPGPNTIHLFTSALTSLPGDAAQQLSQLFLFVCLLLSEESLEFWVQIIKVVEYCSNHIRKMKECNKRKVPVGLFRKWPQTPTQIMLIDPWLMDVLDDAPGSYNFNRLTPFWSITTQKLTNKRWFFLNINIIFGIFSRNEYVSASN